MSSSNGLHDLEVFLQKEKQMNLTNGSWSKLSKSLKMKKMTEYVGTYKQEHGLTEENTEMLHDFLKECVNKNMIQKAKDISYDKNTGKLKKINSLFYNNQRGKFTLKNTDGPKRMSTLKHMGKRPVKKEELVAADVTITPANEDETL
jgi:hypothetical protein